jgi:hypothetical protein
MRAPICSGEWMSARGTWRALHCNRWNVARICEAAGVRVLRLPTMPPRYNREDVMALAARSITRGPVPAATSAPKGELASV